MKAVLCDSGCTTLLAARGPTAVTDGGFEYLCVISAGRSPARIESWDICGVVARTIVLNKSG